LSAIIEILLAGRDGGFAAAAAPADGAGVLTKKNI